MTNEFIMENIIEKLNSEIPEVFAINEDELSFQFTDNDIPVYLYFQTLEILFLKLLKNEIMNDELLIRVLDFMENMACSNDVEVQTLLQVQILEALFGLDYNTFRNMEYRLLRQNTLKLFQELKMKFNVPKSLE